MSSQLKTDPLDGHLRPASTSLLRQPSAQNKLEQLGPNIIAWPAELEISIVIPTYNERLNIEPLVASISESLKADSWEIIFVDDNSPDKTAELVRSIAARSPQIRCLKRIGRRGLSSACIEGMLATSAPIICVMDGDLQHNPQTISLLIEQIKEQKADLAIASRFTDGASTAPEFRFRLRLSQLATALSRIVLKHRVADPLSGFFVIRREIFEPLVSRLSGIGFKILLDILTCLKSSTKIVEVPFNFGNRAHGKSKIEKIIVWEYLLLIAHRVLQGVLPIRFISFCVVGAVGVILHLAVLYLLTSKLGTSFKVAHSTSALLAMISNFSINNTLTYCEQQLKGSAWIKGLISFIAACSIGGLANISLATYLYLNGFSWLAAASAGILVGAVWNFSVTQLFTWSKA